MPYRQLSSQWHVKLRSSECDNGSVWKTYQAMNTCVRLFLALMLVLLISAHQLPAPIREEPESTPKPKTKAASEESTQATKKKDNKPTLGAFVGTWTGTVTGSFRSDIGLNVSSSNAFRNVKISSDGTVTWFGQSGSSTGPPAQSRVILSKDGRRVDWTLQKNEQGGISRGTFSLQLSGPNAAAYQENASFSSSQGNGTIQTSGTLSKQ